MPHQKNLGEPLEGEQLIDQMASTPLLSHVEEIKLGRLLNGQSDALAVIGSMIECALPDELYYLTIYQETLRENYKQSRDKMFYANIRLVLEIANHTHRLEYMERVQLGSIGLWRATELFKVERGNRFSTYATWWIRQAIMRGADETDSTIRLPVHVRDVLRDIRRAEEIYFQEVGKSPTPEVLSKLTGHSVDKIKRVIAFMEHPQSLEDILETEDGSGNERGAFAEDMTAKTEHDYVESDHAQEIKQVVHRALCLLEAYIPEGSDKPQYTRHARVLRLRFRINEMIPNGEEPFRTLQEVGDLMGITRERARQLQKDAVRWLKANVPELRTLLNHINGEDLDGS